MSTTLNAYINFRDTARDAFEFYKTIFGGELRLSTFGEFHATEDASENDKIMHAMLTTPGGMTLMGADSPNAMNYSGKPSGYSLSLSGDNANELRGYWDRLSEGGTVDMPLEKQVWGDEFGMVTDKFGINWMINISAAQQPAERVADS
jgi:PhnB protein